MGILEQIIGMRNQGISDDEIVARLQERGITPQAINDALNQAEIKKAVSNDYQNAPGPSQEGEYPRENYQPQEQQYSPQEYSPQQNYEQQYSPSGGFDSSTIIEISEKVFSEKTQKMQKQMKEIVEFKVLAESQINSISERLKRIEAMIDKLQAAILEKVGSYGRGIENVQKEMQMMQDSFGKVVNPLVEKSGRKTLNEISMMPTEEEMSSEESKPKRSRKNF
ncbi:MAG: hypothetical protein AABX93_03415 [Nanoarchaeota archaeon]